MRGPERRPDPEQGPQVPPPGEARSGRRPCGLDDVDAALGPCSGSASNPASRRSSGAASTSCGRRPTSCSTTPGGPDARLEAEEAGRPSPGCLSSLALEDELRLVDHFLVEHGDRLANGGRNYLLDLRETFVSLLWRSTGRRRHA
ncbi:MAG: hypothetical protein R3F30_06710 [Planctomycetota bacterium]